MEEKEKIEVIPQNSVIDTSAEIDKKGIGRFILQAYYLNNRSITEIARKNQLNWHQVGYYIEKHESQRTQLWQTIKKKQDTQVLRQLEKVSDKLWVWLNIVEKSLQDWKKSPQAMLSHMKVLTKLADSIESKISKHFEIVKDVYKLKEQEDLKNAFFEVIKEIDETTANKILEKLREYKEKRTLLP